MKRNATAILVAGLWMGTCAGCALIPLVGAFRCENAYTGQMWEGNEAFGRNLEGGARARGILEEDIEHALAREHGLLLLFALGVGLRRIEDAGDQGGGQALDAEQVTLRGQC